MEEEVTEFDGRGQVVGGGEEGGGREREREVGRMKNAR